MVQDFKKFGEGLILDALLYAYSNLCYEEAIPKYF